MSRYIINIVLLLFFIAAYSQQDSLAVPVDTLPHVRQPVKIRFGFDVGKFVWAKMKNSSSYDFYVDANFYKQYYLILQAGVANHLTESALLNYNTQGTYYKIGVDYNLYDNWPGMDNDITVGFRYAFSRFDYHLHSYRINQPGAVFVPQPNEVDRRYENLSAHWLDITTKVQVETLRHLYLGYAVSIKYLLNYSRPDNFDVSYIPGFFERNAYSRFGFGMQYFVSYRIIF